MAHGSQPYQRRTGEADGTVRIQGGREGTRLEMKVQEVKQSLETAFIDRTINSNLAYQPEFISNDYKQGKKVLVSLEKELKKVNAELQNIKNTPNSELIAAQGKEQKIGGYYHPSFELTEKAMRPSETLNTILAKLN